MQQQKEDLACTLANQKTGIPLFCMLCLPLAPTSEPR